MDNIYIIEIPIPYWIPIENGSTFVSSFDKKDYKVSFSVTFKKNKNIGTDLKIKFLITDNRFHEIDFSIRTNLAVVLTLKHINRLFDVMRDVTDFHQIPNISIIDLPTFINISYNDNKFQYVTNPKKEKGKIKIKKDFIQKYIQIISIWDNYPEIEIVDKYHGYAKYHLDREELNEAILDLQTSFEVFLRHSYKYILTIDKISLPKNIYEIPLRNLIENILSKHLGENLSYNQNKIISSWYNSLYRLRNKIIHEGYSTTDGNQAYLAYDSYFNARNYIADLMRKRGYLNENMDIDLSVYKKNLPTENEKNEILRELKKKNMLPQNTKVL